MYEIERQDEIKSIFQQSLLIKHPNARWYEKYQYYISEN